MFNQSLADKALDNTDKAMDATQAAASQTLDKIDQAIEAGMGRLRDTSQQLRQSAARMSDGTVSYIRQDPVKSVLIAAATGAALMALVSLLNRSNHR